MAITIKYWGLYKRYRKTIKENRVELEEKFNLRIDYVNRLYTVFNIDEKDYKQYGDELYNDQLNKYINDIDVYLKSKKLIELYGVDEKIRIDNLNTLLTIRFSLFDTKKLANIIRNISIISVVSIIISLFIWLF